jgi:hypothetical protein
VNEIMAPAAEPGTADAPATTGFTFERFRDVRLGDLGGVCVAALRPSDGTLIIDSEAVAAWAAAVREPQEVEEAFRFVAPAENNDQTGGAGRTAAPEPGELGTVPDDALTSGRNAPRS